MKKEEWLGTQIREDVYVCLVTSLWSASEFQVGPDEENIGVGPWSGDAEDKGKTEKRELRA